MPTEKPDKETELRWAKDPANYKLGLFYYNKEDARFFIKNWDMNYRGKSFILNFARPNALLFYIVLMLFLISIIVVVAYFADGK